MKVFRAKEAGRYLAMTVNGRDISIHESRYLDKGELMNHPDGAFVMMVVASPESEVA